MDLANLNLAESLPVVCTIDPVVNISAKTVGDVVDMADLLAVLFLIQTGDISAAETIDAGVESSAAVGMGSPASVKTITQRTGSATTNDNLQFVIFVRGAELTEGHRYIRPYITPGGALGAAAPVSLIGLAVPKYQPGITTIPDLTTVTEIKT